MTDRAFFTVIYRGPSEAEVRRRYAEHASRMADRGMEPVSEQRSHSSRETIIAVTYQQSPPADAEASPEAAAVPARSRTSRPTRGPW